VAAAIAAALLASSAQGGGASRQAPRASAACTDQTAFSENFDGVAAPGLPPDWIAVNLTGASPLWETSTTSPDTSPNDAFVAEPAGVTDKVLASAAIAISASAQSAQLTFRNNYDFEGSGLSYFDGGVLEISFPNVNPGVYQDIVAAGGSFVTGGYNGQISTVFGNPLAGRQAWGQDSGGYITTTVDLPAAVIGQTIRLRWRMGSDQTISDVGWRIDTINLTECLTVTAVTMRTLSAIRSRGGVLVRWRTGTEAELLGFQVYRSRRQGWQRLTRRLIAAKGSMSGASYRFLDRTAMGGVAYRYRIKAVDRDGGADWFGPVHVK
jgi:hypothetical protein